MLPPSGRDRDELLRAAVAAPSMHNMQPWKFLQWLDAAARVNWLHLATSDAGSEDDRSVARTEERRVWVGGVRSVDGVPSAALGPRAAMSPSPARDLAATPADARRPAEPFEKQPQLAILATRRDGPAEWLRAGQAMERVLLEATAEGLSTALLNQAIEHDNLRWLLP